MATPDQIKTIPDFKRGRHASVGRPSNDDSPEPTGFIRVDGKALAIWLPKDVCPNEIGLKTFRKTRRWPS